MSGIEVFVDGKSVYVGYKEGITIDDVEVEISRVNCDGGSCMKEVIDRK